MTGDEVDKFFQYEHLPPHLAAVSRPFCELAELMMEFLPRCSQRSIGLQRLLEAKDCAVRARLVLDDQVRQPQGEPERIDDITIGVNTKPAAQAGIDTSWTAGDEAALSAPLESRHRFPPGGN